MRNRVHLPEFKLEVCQKIASGELSQAQACREYQLCHSVIERWYKQYREKSDQAFTPKVSPDQLPLAPSPEQRLLELERLVGQLTLDNELLKRALKLSRPRNAAS